MRVFFRGRLRISAAAVCLWSALGASGGQSPAAGEGPIRLVDVAEGSGLDFVLDNGASPEKRMIEPMTGGVAVFDFDNDGRLDVFFANGAEVPALKKSGPQFANRLYRNLGEFKFEDVTDSAGVAGEGYSMGVAVGDFDNDGWIDLFVAGVFRNLLYRNQGDGKFREVTAQAKIKSDLWSVAAGWFDYDRDGLLDLFVVNYVEWSPEGERFCGDKSRGIRVYCHPKYYQGVANQLYRNRGDGVFEDVTAASGVGDHPGRGMSAAFGDFDGDGWSDVFVTNDNLPNSLFRNRGDGTFEETALLAGVALREHGKPVASMGADFRDYDNDGRPDIAVTALDGETFPLFRNLGDGFFEDATYSSGIARHSIRRSGWSNGFADLDNDGDKDLFTANSHVNDLIELFEASRYKQSNAVFENRGGGRFADVTERVGTGFQTPRGHRGSAFGDFDGDGRIDVVVTSIQERTELWRNVSPGGGHWILLRLVGTKSNRDGVGARVKLGGQHNVMTTASGYASSSHLGVHFGLGETERVDRIEILWPSGTRQVLTDVAADQALVVKEPGG